MATLSDSYTDLGDTEDSYTDLGDTEDSESTAAASPFSFPDDTSHPLSSYSQRAAPAAPAAPAYASYTLAGAQRLFQIAQQNHQAATAYRDAVFHRIKMQEQNKTMADSAAAMQKMSDLDPHTEGFEDRLTALVQAHPHAVRDPAFNEMFKFYNDIYNRDVKGKQAEARQVAQNTLAHERTQALQTHSEEMAAKRTQAGQDTAELNAAVSSMNDVGKDQYSKGVANLGEVGVDGVTHRDVMNDVVRPILSSQTSRAAEANLLASEVDPKEIDTYRNPDTGYIDPQKYEDWQVGENAARKVYAEADKLRPHLTALMTTMVNADYKGNTTPEQRQVDAQTMAAYQGQIRHAEELQSSRNPKVLVGRTNDFLRQVSEQGVRQRAYLEEMKKPVEQRNADILAANAQGFEEVKRAALAHPGFTSGPYAHESAEGAAERLQANRRALAAWPVGAPVRLNGNLVLVTDQFHAKAVEAAAALNQQTAAK